MLALGEQYRGLGDILDQQCVLQRVITYLTGASARGQRQACLHRIFSLGEDVSPETRGFMLKFRREDDCDLQSLSENSERIVGLFMSSAFYGSGQVVRQPVWAFATWCNAPPNDKERLLSMTLEEYKPKTLNPKPQTITKFDRLVQEAHISLSTFVICMRRKLAFYVLCLRE